MEKKSLWLINLSAYNFHKWKQEIAMTHMDRRTGVSRAPSRTSHLSCCTIKKEPPIENVSQNLKTAKAGLALANFGSRENSMVLRFPQQKEILKRNFLHPKNVNERKQAVFWFVLSEKSYLFLSLPWQIIWLKPCCSCHTSWVTSIRWSDLTIMQEIPPYFLKTFELINSPVL